MPPASPTLLDLLKKTSDFFASKGLESPRLQAELLLAAILGCGRLELYMQFDKILTPAEIDAYRESVRRRALREPLQHIVGSAAFRGLEIQVNDRVLIPRPETEGVVEVALQRLDTCADARVLDLGCGSGAIALAVAQERKGAQVTAVDISEAALEVARANAEANGVAERIEWLCGDLFEALGAAATYDLIVSNPPYIPSGDIAALEPEVRDFEPRQALDGGADGLEFYRRIAVEAPAYLEADGDLVLEIGAGQHEAVAALFDKAGWGAPEVQADLAGIMRVVAVRRAP